MQGDFHKAGRSCQLCEATHGVLLPGDSPSAETSTVSGPRPLCGGLLWSLPKILIAPIHHYHSLWATYSATYDFPAPSLVYLCLYRGLQVTLQPAAAGGGNLWVRTNPVHIRPIFQINRGLPKEKPPRFSEKETKHQQKPNPSFKTALLRYTCGSCTHPGVLHLYV